LVASLAQIPGLADSPDKGTVVDIVKAIDDVYPGKIKIELYPFARSINNVIEGKADFHIPILRNPAIPSTKLPYQFVTEAMGYVSIVICSNQDKIITRKMIDDALAKGGQFPYIIEVAAGLEPNYPFPSIGFNDLDQTILKLKNKRIDAFMWTPMSSAPNKITQSPYGKFDDAILIPKGPKGDETNQILSDCLKKLRASGRLQELYKKMH
jgi:polar amino acid transport system substrate-binding protein